MISAKCSPVSAPRSLLPGLCSPVSAPPSENDWCHYNFITNTSNANTLIFQWNFSLPKTRFKKIKINIKCSYNI